MKDATLFFLRFLQNRGQIGSVIPSSRFLSKTVMKMIPFETAHTLIELGAGTGALTKEIVRNKRKDSTLVVLEPDQKFASLLAQKFANEPSVMILPEKADELQNVFRKLGLAPPDGVVSSLPFALLGEKLSEKIFSEIQALLPRGGVFVLYQYTVFTLPLLLKHFSIKRFAFVPLNIPPALVFKCGPRSAF